MSAVMQPAQPPELPVLPKTPAKVQRPPVWPKLLVFILVLTSAAAYFLFRPSTKAPAVAGPATVKASVGPLITTLRMAGTTSAHNFVNVTAPLLRGPERRGSLVLLYLVKSGATVNRVEKIAEIDAHQ